MKAYLDASVLVPMIAIEASTDNVRAFLGGGDVDFSLSLFGLGEAVSAVSRLVRMGEMREEMATLAVRQLEAWAKGRPRIELTIVDLQKAIALVGQFALKLRMPDAIHLALCQRTRSSLITFDRRLAEAARQVGIDAVTPA